jgi:hypothetical protein
MPRSKTGASKLPKALRTPIDDGWPPLSVQLNESELKAWQARSRAAVFVESLAKLDGLMDELKIPQTTDPRMRFVLLSLALARKLYRGFLCASEAKPAGRPRRGQGKVKIAEVEASAFHNGQVYMPDGSIFDDPIMALVLVDELRKSGNAASDEEACAFLLTAQNKDLAASRNRAELKRKAGSMACIVATTRMSTKRKADGKLN